MQPKSIPEPLRPSNERTETPYTGQIEIPFKDRSADQEKTIRQLEQQLAEAKEREAWYQSQIHHLTDTMKLLEAPKQVQPTYLRLWWQFSEHFITLTENPKLGRDYSFIMHHTHIANSLKENTSMTMASRHVFSALMPVWLYAAWFIALTATLGALFIGEVLGQTPCVLCWYQRIAMFPLALILGVACMTNDQHIGRYALPLALTGGAIALWHSLLYAGIVKEALVPCQRNGSSCTDSAMLTVANLPIPYLSLISFVAITILLILFYFHNKSPKVKT